MKNIFIKIIAIIVSVISIITCVACSSGTSFNPGVDDPSSGGGTHYNGTTDTSKYILNNGVTSYKILLAEDAGTYTQKAVAEFNTFIKEATGLTFEIVSTDISYSQDAKYISFGKNNLLTTSGIAVDYKLLGNQGYTIKTVGDSIFIAGGDKGVLYGAYDLLKYLVNFEQFTSNYYTIDKKVTTLKLQNYNIVEVPDFEYRIAPYGSLYNNSVPRERMRMIHDSEIFILGANTHSIFNIIPKSNKDEHPSWFSSDMLQLCYTAHGDADEFELLVSTAVEKCKELIDNDPYHNILSISQDDFNVWCACSACSQLKTTYGTDSASQIIFVNEVAKRVEEWLIAERDGREVIFDILAYHKTEIAPTKKNADGTYSAIDDKVVLRKNVEVMVAPLNSDFISGIHNENNTTLKNLFLSWQPVTSRYTVWSYDCYFGQYLTPYDSWGAMQDFCKFLKSMNTTVIFPQGAYNQRQNSNFDNLKTYLYSKLLWNVDYDVKELIHRYFNAVYRDASSTMEQAYWQMRSKLYEHTLNGRDGSIWTDTATQDNYSKRYLQNQIDTMLKALDIVEKYKETDYAFYKMVKNEITLETIGPRYMMIVIYLGTFSDTNRKAYVEEFAKDVRELSVDRISEGTSMEEFLKTIL